MKVAALDLGSNTFLCLIANVEKDENGIFYIQQIFSDEVKSVRLGQDVSKTKKLHPEALLRASECLKNFKKQIDKYNPEKILAMGTSAARDAENREELFKIGNELGIPIEIIPGSKEASITYCGAISGQVKNYCRLVIDIGGGSTEFIVGDLTAIHESKSLDIGCVRLTEQFITTQPTSDHEIDQVEKVIAKQLLQITHFSENPFDEILAIAGTPTALAVAHLGLTAFDASKIDGYLMSLETLHVWKIKLKNATIEQKIAMGIPPGRADVILVGVIILIQAMILFNKNAVTVSTRGVRHGIALELAKRFLF